MVAELLRRIHSEVNSQTHIFIMEAPIFKLVALALAIAVWILSLRSIMVGKWLGELVVVRRDKHPILFWCGVGIQNLVFGYFVLAISRELFAWLRGGA